MLTALLLNTSYLYLPVGTAIMLNFLYPHRGMCCHGNCFKAGFSRLQVMAVAVSIAGMAFTGAGGHSLFIGIIMAIASSFTYGGYLIANEKGPANSLPIETKLFYVCPCPEPWCSLFCRRLLGPCPLRRAGSGDGCFLIGGSGLFTVGGYFS